MKKMNLLLRKCKSLSRQLGRSSSYSSLRSKSSRDGHDRWSTINPRQNEEMMTSARDDHHHHHRQQDGHEAGGREIIFVGSTRKRYVISSKYLSHPLLKSLIEKPGDVIVVKCEVVLFDHLLWMLDNAGPSFGCDSSLEELAELYVF